MPRFLANVIGNQLVWLCAVVGAGHGLRWPALLAAAVYVTSQLALSRHPRVERVRVGPAGPMTLPTLPRR